MTDAEKAAADKAATDKAAADKAAADKRAGEQQAKDQRAGAEELAKTPVIVVGDAKLGGPFSISGSGFGGSKGTLTIGGRVFDTTRWNDVSVKGQLPPGVRGDVVLTTSSGVRRGVFPHPVENIVKTTTVTVETVPAK